MIINVQNKEQFDAEIAKGRCLVDFYATWCGPCKMLAPVIEELDQANKLNGVTVLKVDCDECRDLASEYKVQAIPTLLLFENKNVIKSSMGFLNENDLINFVK